MSMVVFIGNCQTRAIGQLYETFAASRRGETVRYIESYQDLTDGARAVLRGASILVEQVANWEPKALAEGVNPAARRVPCPLVAGGFLWPFAGEPRQGNAPLPYLIGGPFPGELSDRFLNRLIQEERSPEYGLEAYLEADVTCSIDRMHELYMERQQRRDEICGFSIAPLIAEHFRTEPLFFTPHHPGLRITLALAEQLFERLGAGEAIGPMRERVWRSPFPRNRLPIHPRVAAHFGLTFADESTRYRYGPEALVTFRQWVVMYMRGEWSADLREGISRVGADPAQALEQLNKALRTYPDSPDGNHAKGEALRRLGRPQDALPFFRRAVALLPDESLFHYGLSVCLFALEQFREAQDEARVAVFQDPGNQHYYATLAQAARSNKDPVTAEHALREAIKVNPQTPHIYNFLGHVLSDVQRFEEAEESVRHALRLDPDRAGFHDNLATILLRQNRVEEGLLHAERAAALEPHNPRYNLALAQRLNDAGRLPEAEETARRAAACDPAADRPHDFLGHLLARMGRVHEAIKEFEEADRLHPNSAPRLSALSHSLARVGRNTEALAAILAAIALDPSKPNYFAHAGNLLRQEGGTAAARHALIRALELEPEHKFARSLLGEMGCGDGARPETGTHTGDLLPS